MRLFAMLVVIGACASRSTVLAAGPADELLRLVPLDAGMTLTVEGLRDHVREIGGSPLLAGLRRLPAVRAWLASERFRKFNRAVRDIEAALRIPAGVIRDELIGDAVVLTLKPGPPEKPGEGRGLLIARPRDRALVESLMKALNDAQLRGGELTGIEARTRGTVRYAARIYRQAGRPAEFYAHIEGGAFAWSNSEEMLLGVIDRKRTGMPGLGDDPAFLKVRRGLPEKAIASLFLNPRLVDRALADPNRPVPPGSERLAAMIGRYVAAVGYAGIALQWRDGFFLHSHESIDPAKLDPWLRGWMSRPPSKDAPTALVPESILAVASAHVDYQAIRDALTELVPDDDRPGLENFRLALQGLLLGRDPNADVLPRLGPSTLFYVESGAQFPLVGVLGWSSEGPDLAAPLDNALRTAMAFYALDPKRKAAHLRVESRAVGEARLTTLTDGLRPILSYRVDQGRIVLGNVPEEVARFGTSRPGTLLTEVRPKYFPHAETFALVDLGRLAREIRNRRGPIAQRLAARSGRPVEAVDRDLGHLLGLADLFWAAGFTSASAADASEVHRTLGLIAR